MDQWQTSPYNGATDKKWALWLRHISYGSGNRRKHGSISEELMDQICGDAVNASTARGNTGGRGILGWMVGMVAKSGHWAG